MRLRDLRLEPLRIVPPQAPEFLVTDSASGDVYAFSLFYSNESNPLAPVVALYTCGALKLVVKALPPGENSREDELVALASASGDLVAAHVACVGAPLAPGEELRHRHFTVVLMEHGGGPLYWEAPMAAADILHAVAWTARACLRLFESYGLAYTDIKPANVLRNPKTRALLLCDYGSMEEAGLPVGTATYPPPETPYGMDVMADQRALAYGLGVLIVGLHDEGLLHHLAFRPVTSPLEIARADLALGCEQVMQAVHDPELAPVLRTAWAPGATVLDVLAMIPAAAGGDRKT